MNSKLLILGLIVACAAPVQASELETLFKGFEQGCQMNPDFDSFHRSLVQENPQYRFGKNQYYLPGQPKLPQGIRANLGKLEVIPDQESNEFSEAKLTLEGSFYGLPVTSYSGFYGHGNGIGAMSLTINAPLATVQQVLKQKGVTITSSEDGLIFEAILSPKDNVTEMICDWSN
jgi:hypothetical protein